MWAAGCGKCAIACCAREVQLVWLLLRSVWAAGCRKCAIVCCAREVRLVWLLLRFGTACSGLVCRRGGEETGGRSGIVACGCDVVCEGWAREARPQEELLWSVWRACWA